MKKYLTVVLLVCAICLLLSSCGWYQKGENFSEDFLKSVSLEEMPKPNCEVYAVNSMVADTETLRMEITLNNFEVYINSFIDYMNDRDDVYYFGNQESDGLLGEMLPHRVANPIEGDFKWESGINWYSFAYSLTGELGEASACSTHNQYTNPIIVRFEYDAEKGMAYVKISKNGTFGSSCIDESLSTPYVFELDYTETYYRIAGVRQDLSGEITLPETYKGLPVKELGSWGFKANGYTGGTDSVTKVTIPDCYEKIGYKAFNKLPNLKIVIIGNGVKEIGPGAFEGCKNLETVIFGSSVEAIYAEAFQYCEKLDNVVLPSSLKEITYRAFGECKALKTIVIPRGVTKMLADVFYENDSLTDVFCEADGPSEEWDPEWLGCDREYNENKDVRVTFGYGKETAAIYYPISFDTIGYSHEPIFADRASYLYKAGDTVEFYLEPGESGEAAPIYVNGELHEAIDSTASDTEDGKKTLWRYSFTMPESHVVVSFEKEAE